MGMQTSFGTCSLHLIRCFVAVGRRLSISRDVGDPRVTQSAMSKHVRALEDYLGVRVLKRKHLAIELTADGERVVRRVDPWLQPLAEATRLIETEYDAPASAGGDASWLLQADSEPRENVRAVAKWILRHAQDTELALTG